jgi:hypothetical protein
MDDQRKFAAVLFQDLLRAIGAAIVHDDDGEPQMFIGQALENSPQQIAYVRLFVVSR